MTVHGLAVHPQDLLPAFLPQGIDTDTSLFHGIGCQEKRSASFSAKSNPHNMS